MTVQGSVWVTAKVKSVHSQCCRSTGVGAVTEKGCPKERLALTRQEEKVGEGSPGRRKLRLRSWDEPGTSTRKGGICTRKRREMEEGREGRFSRPWLPADPELRTWRPRWNSEQRAHLLSVGLC